MDEERSAFQKSTNFAGGGADSKAANGRIELMEF